MTKHIRTVVLVPRRAGNAERDRLWEFARAWWVADHPDWPVYEGHHDDGPFNRSAAVNRAAAAAGDWDVAVIIDADIIINAEAVREAVGIGYDSNQIVLPHKDRVMLTAAGTRKIMGGYRGSWRASSFVETVFTDSVSCVVVVSRTLWDTVNGFDEQFVGWGFEDTAFCAAAETLTGPIIRLKAEVFHLWHEKSPETRRDTVTYRANAARRGAYLAARGNPAAIKKVIAMPAGGRPGTRIPRILHRTVPEVTTPQVEAWWGKFAELHPDWELRTYRDPLDQHEWPLTSAFWRRCRHGAQKAGLIRLEALVTVGGVYVDSDVEPFRPLDVLLGVPAFAAWEDETTVPDAVLGAEAYHPAFIEALKRATAAVARGADPWVSGPGVTTAVLPNRDDVLLLPPGSFYPAHYLEKGKLGTRTSNPWVFLEHKWHHSWGTPEQVAGIRERQRDE